MEREVLRPARILAYAQHVAERFDLKRGIDFNTRVLGAEFDEENAQWRVDTDRGESVTARFVIMATGCLSSHQTPAFEGMERFKGRTYHTAQWPHEGVDFSGQRVAVIGTGSTAIQAIPVIAEQAAHLTVFQRTPNYSIPTRNGPMTADYEQSWKSDYAALRDEARQTKNGILANQR